MRKKPKLVLQFGATIISEASISCLETRKRQRPFRVFCQSLVKEIKVGEVSRGSYQLHLHNNDPLKVKGREGTQCIKDKGMSKSGGPDESLEEENYTCIQEGKSSDSD